MKLEELGLKPNEQDQDQDNQWDLRHAQDTAALMPVLRRVVLELVDSTGSTLEQLEKKL